MKVGDTVDYLLIVPTVAVTELGVVRLDCLNSSRPILSTKTLSYARHYLSLRLYQYTRKLRPAQGV